MKAFPFAATKYGKRKFKILYGQIAFDVFMFKKRIEGCNMSLMSYCFQMGDFDRETCTLESDILTIEHSSINIQDQLLCDRCGIINRNEPCEHMLDDPLVVSWYNRRVSTQELDCMMKALKRI